jgi:hypothetical protein
MQCHSLVNVDVMVPLMKAWNKRAESSIWALLTMRRRISRFWPTGWRRAISTSSKSTIRSTRVRPRSESFPRQRTMEQPSALTCLSKKPVFTKSSKADLCQTLLRNWKFRLGSAFFLKWVISNPLVTAVLPATTNPDYLDENMFALRYRRKRLEVPAIQGGLPR